MALAVDPHNITMCIYIYMYEHVHVFCKNIKRPHTSVKSREGNTGITRKWLGQYEEVV